MTNIYGEVGGGNQSAVRTNLGLGIADSPVFAALTAGVSPPNAPYGVLYAYQNNTNEGADSGLTIEQAGTGDPMINWYLTNSSSWGAGIDNSVLDNFVIAYGGNFSFPALSLKPNAAAIGNGGFFDNSPSRMLQINSGTGASYISINAESTEQVAIDFFKSAVQKWAMYMPSSSNDMRWYDGSNDCLIFETGGSFTMSSSTTIGKQLLQLAQNDADQAFIDFAGTSAANTSNNITTFTVGATLQGYIRVEINNTVRWMPFYTAPLS